ncbi:MAG: hypothetical protein G01um101418_205 [Parcubacteria group bacterium Gr01-1014_18]|nr:MAG: hypothetical protein Greene041636_173 [Parcubacteria group bacterium Greene0416_36]TSC81365.1 MAG: hypothetical protein G01um101418_205 [Parcubacteria group bacterium Gr01-1014_18]TSC99449.1 MAG: hypothetical protein Greene101420_116 [Parcubacteria group bacterium Greene1014_20]TSD07632.1 MAG: hypothetical protein Greene07142_89 [Parcubacteria group bacterium Greene0714_2]
MSESKKRLKLVVTEKCIGCVTCEVLCPEVFKLENDGRAHIKDGFDAEKNKKGIDESILACPTQAIEWQSEDTPSSPNSAA